MSRNLSLATVSSANALLATEKMIKGPDGLSPLPNFSALSTTLLWNPAHPRCACQCRCALAAAVAACVRILHRCHRCQHSKASVPTALHWHVDSYDSRRSAPATAAAACGRRLRRRGVSAGACVCPPLPMSLPCRGPCSTAMMPRCQLLMPQPARGSHPAFSYVLAVPGFASLKN